jgi:hypothetical protein
MAVSLFFISPSAIGNNITCLIQAGVGQSWDTASGWSDRQTAATSFAQNTDNTYEVPTGKRLRTPGDGDTSFPQYPSVDSRWEQSL